MRLHLQKECECIWMSYPSVFLLSPILILFKIHPVYCCTFRFLVEFQSHFVNYTGGVSHKPFGVMLFVKNLRFAVLMKINGEYLCSKLKNMGYNRRKVLFWYFRFSVCNNIEIADYKIQTLITWFFIERYKYFCIIRCRIKILFIWYKVVAKSCLWFSRYMRKTRIAMSSMNMAL